MNLARRFVAWLLRPLRRFLLRGIVIEDAWEPITSFAVKPRLFGLGSTRRFSWYLEGPSTVPVTTVEDVCDWLSQAQYVSDPELFNEPDFWQHPRTFEHLRKGDCEDHALWAWRKLLELGFKAEFFVGQWQFDQENSGHHAWVVFERDGLPFLLDPVLKDLTRMVQALHAHQTDYRPHFSVDKAGKMLVRGGYVLYLQERDRSRRPKSTGQAA